ncbi:MAG: YggS family pyridoxal phosphate-dependent enzyme [Nitrospinae bacterium]|nr:YggS family pyridoxal phosphate-dependent enzyme [Nitrospinota bacterium]
MTDIATNVQSVLQTIRDAAMQSGREPHTVQLVAATKYVEAERVRQAIAAGITICGENRLQEAQAKMEAIGTSPGLTWHFIGRVQRRKLKSMVGRFSVIHSIESLEHIEELHRRAEERQLQQSILLQVNIGNESTKGGFSASDLLKAIPGIVRFSHVKVDGLMAIPPREEDPEAMRPYFQKVKILAEEIDALHLPGVDMKELSMGMSNDYPIAIQEGATFVRVGAALFGARPQ